MRLLSICRDDHLDVLLYIAERLCLLNDVDFQVCWYHLQKMALQSHEECLQKLDELRRIFYKEYLLPDGSWPPIAKVITIKKPFK